jgi:hypothetical protein
MEGKYSVFVAALLVASTLALIHEQNFHERTTAEQGAIDAKTPTLNYKEQVSSAAGPRLDDGRNRRR